jgi:predicted RNA binding protein YcfA (HicA-like mRNA interferase family)
MTELPVLKPRQVIAVLERLGFIETRHRGSHKQFRHPDGRVTTVPVHGARDISPNLLRRIIEDTHLLPETFLKLL